MFDEILKLLSDQYGAAIVGFFQSQLGLPSGGPFEVVPSSLPLGTVEADRVFRIERPVPMLIHTEWESSSRLGRADRFLEYNVLLTRQTRLPVQTVVLLLRPEAVSSDLTGTLSRSLPMVGTYLDFRYTVIRLWQVPTDLLLSEPGLTPLAPLGAVSENDLPELARRMEAKWAELDPREAGRLLVATEVLLGLKYSVELVEGLFSEIATMEESSVYQHILAKGVQKGVLAGALDQARRTLVRAGTRQFGPPSEDVRQMVESVSELDRLDRMLDRVPDAADWSAVLATE